MAVSHAQKIQILEDLKSNATKQKAVLLLSTNGVESTLGSEMNTKMRQESRKLGIIIKVVKNTLIKKTFKDLPDLVGQTYLAYLEDSNTGDEITVPKAVVGLVSADFKQNFNILGSFVNGEFYDSNKTKTLANTPSLDQSLAQIAGTINQITTNLALIIKELPSSVARGISEATKSNA